MVSILPFLEKYRCIVFILLQVFLSTLAIDAHAQTGAPCDCSEFVGTCSASVSKVESSSIVEGSWFNHRLDIKTSTKKCAFVVMYFPESSTPNTVTVIGGYDQGIWNLDRSKRRYTPIDFSIASCDICIGKSDDGEFEDNTPQNPDLSKDILGLADDGLYDIDREHLQNIKNNQMLALNDRSLVNSQMSQFEREKKLLELNSHASSANRQLFDMTLQTANSVSEALSKDQALTSGTYSHVGSGHPDLVQECRSKTAHLTGQMNSFKQEYGTITKADALKVIKHNQLGVKAANICLQIFPVGSNEYNLTLQGRNTYQAAIANARAHFSSLNSANPGQNCNRNAYASEMPCSD